MATVAASRDGLKEWLWEWGMEASTEDERLLRFAKGWTQAQINEALIGKSTREALVSTRILFNHERKDMALHVVPRSLLAAIWLQCARVLTLNPEFRQCHNCGKWFELSHDARRKTTKYCEDRCKVAAYRKRKDAVTVGS
jgi:hypothetical protein